MHFRIAMILRHCVSESLLLPISQVRLSVTIVEEVQEKVIRIAHIHNFRSFLAADLPRYLHTYTSESFPSLQMSCTCEVIEKNALGGEVVDLI